MITQACSNLQIFDLKGSVRSRYVHNSGKEEVLMDENLLESKTISYLDYNTYESLLALLGLNP